MITKESTRIGFGGWNAEYRPRMDGGQRSVMRWASIEENDRVLDMDCGGGALLIALSGSLRIRACGMSREPGEARQIMEVIDGADIITASPSDIPFRDNSFDEVFVTRRPGENLSIQGAAEAERVLRPGGELIVACRLFPGLRRFFSGGGEPEMDRRALMRRLQENGFRHISFRRSGLGGVITAWKRDAIDS